MSSSKLRAGRQIGRRGGLAGLGDRLRDRVEPAVGRGAWGIRRSIVLGVVLGEDEGLPGAVQDDFRASGSTTSWPSRARTSPSWPQVSTGLAGCYASGGASASSRSSASSPRTSSPLAGSRPFVRAGVAGGLASLAWLAARPSDRWHFLAVGALVLMAWMPTALLEPGFQLRSRLLLRSSWRSRACGAGSTGTRCPPVSPTHSPSRLPAACDGADRSRALRPGAQGLHGGRERRRIRCRAGGHRTGIARRDRRPLSPPQPQRVSHRSRAGRRPGSSSSHASSRTCRARRSEGGLRSRSRCACSRPGWHSAGCGGICASIRSGSPPSHSERLRLPSSRPHGSPLGPHRLGIHRRGSVSFLDVGQGDSILLETPRARVLVDQDLRTRGRCQAAPRDGRALAVRARSYAPAARPRGWGGRRHPSRPRRADPRREPRGHLSGAGRGAGSRESAGRPGADRSGRDEPPAGTTRPARPLAGRCWPRKRGPEPTRSSSRSRRRNGRFSSRGCRIGRHGATPAHRSRDSGCPPRIRGSGAGERASRPRPRIVQ